MVADPSHEFGFIADSSLAILPILLVFLDQSIALRSLLERPRSTWFPPARDGFLITCSLVTACEGLGLEPACLLAEQEGIGKFSRDLRLWMDLGRGRYVAYCV